MIGVAVGQQGVGKTHQTIAMMKKYVLGLPAQGIPGRKVLILDVNDEYGEFRAIDAKDIKKFSALSIPEIRRIRPIHPTTGHQMSHDDLAKVLFSALYNFRGGQLILEDINTYIGDNMPQDLIGALCNVRHKDCDVMLHFQSISRLSPKVWQNLSYIRYHKNTDSVDTSIAKKAPDKYELLKIAENIVNKAYETDQRYFLFVEMKQLKIKGNVTRKQMDDGILEYLEQQYNRLISPMVRRRSIGGAQVFTPQSAHKFQFDRLVKAYF